MLPFLASKDMIKKIKSVDDLVMTRKAFSPFKGNLGKKLPKRLPRLPDYLSH